MDYSGLFIPLNSRAGHRSSSSSLKVGGLSCLVAFSMFSLTACSYVGDLSDGIFGSTDAQTSPQSTASSERAFSREPGIDDALASTSPDRTSLDDAFETDPSSSTKFAASAASSATPGLELTWKVPEVPTPAFVIYYGESASSLPHRVEVASARLEKLTDPALGLLYRYVVSDIPADGPLFVSIASFDGISEGPRSETLEASGAL